MTDPPAGDDERPVARWLLEQLDDPATLGEPAADTGEWLLLSSPPITVPAPALVPIPVAVPAGAGTRLGCALLEGVLFVAGLGVGWVIWWVALWSRGETPARSILHLDLVKAGGSTSPRLPRTAVRELLAKALLPAAPISALVFLFGRRSLWDRMTGTTVVTA